MKRDVATDALAAMLANVVVGGRFVQLVENIYVFGSYARGALEPGDIDVYVERGRAEWWGSYAATRLLAGESIYGELRSALVGRSRRFQVQFEPPATTFLADAVLIYSRGDALEHCLSRLHAIQGDEDARRASREPVHAAVEGMQRRIGHGACVGLTALSRLRWLDLERVVLDDGGPALREVRGAYARHAPVAIGRTCGRGPTATAVTAAVGHMQAAGYRLNELGLEDDHLGDALRAAVAEDRLYWERVMAMPLVNWRSPKQVPVRARIQWRLDYDLSERFFGRLGSSAPRLSRLLWIVNPQRGGKATPGGPLLGLLFTPLQRRPFDALGDPRRTDTPEWQAFRREVEQLAGSA